MRCTLGASILKLFDLEIQFCFLRQVSGEIVFVFVLFCFVGRKMLGATMPEESQMGTIRGDHCIDIGRNICHGSDSTEAADREIALWFTGNQLCGYMQNSADWIYE